MGSCSVSLSKNHFPLSIRCKYSRFLSVFLCLALRCAVDPSRVWGYDILPALDESSVLETWNVGGAK
jgi:hypothetical protein